ncbi:hypothetical protein B0H14DRAFT_3753624 [Mycena olivaceomarginata]|nr:hypothetical protein B0H14DRAFT_3753624 [Mycena olivaceomarginata]
MASTSERRTNAGSRMEVLVQAEKPRAKRSHDKVVASGAERVAAAEALVRQRKEAIAYVAVLDVKLDAARAAEDADAIYELPPDAMDVDEGSPAHHASDEDDPMLEITQEQFDRYEDDDTYLSEPEFEKPAPKGKSVVAAVKRAKRPGKLETCRAIEGAGDALVKKKAASGTIEVKKKGVQNSDAAAASSTAGLSKTWRAKASAGPSLGGLTDEDVVAAHPELQDTVKVLRGPRKNDMVGLVNASSDMEETPTNRAGRGNVPIKAAARARTSVKLEAGGPKIPALTVQARTSKTPKIKSLPAFIARTWSTRFLPEVHKMLELVTMLKELLDRLYPGIDWPLEWGDAICSRAVSRIGDRRSAFGKLGVQVVDAVFEDVKYYGDKNLDTPRLRLSTLIASDAKYALQRTAPPSTEIPPRRPSVCGIPRILNTLYVAPLSHTAEDLMSYQKPAGYLESPAVVKTISPVIGNQEWPLVVSYEKDGREVVDFSGLPVGALGMAAAAVERGFKLHASGIRSRPSDFSAANYGTAVNGFIASIKNFRASRWESIFAACGAAAQVQAEEEEEDPDESLDGVRELMYAPSSSPRREYD